MRGGANGWSKGRGSDQRVKEGSWAATQGCRRERVTGRGSIRCREKKTQDEKVKVNGEEAQIRRRRGVVAPNTILTRGK